MVGEIDVYIVFKLKEKFMEIIEYIESEIIVDLIDVLYMDSIGLGVFIVLLKVNKKNNGFLKFVGVLECIKCLFDIMGFIDILNVNL